MVVPKLPKEVIEKYKSAGHWPPPEGIIILIDEEASANDVEVLLKELSQVSTPKQQTYISRAQEYLKLEV